MLPKSHRKNLGFTLIELLVAVAILAIIAVMGWRGLDSIIRARVGLNQELEHSRGAQISFVQLENDCAHLVSEAMLPRRENIRAFDQQLILIRTVYDDNQATRLQVVAYRMKDGVFSRRESVPTENSLFWIAIGSVQSVVSTICPSSICKQTFPLFKCAPGIMMKILGVWQALILPFLKQPI